MQNPEDIQRYLEGSMNASECAEFERLLSTDVHLAAQMALQKRINKALQDKDARAYRQTLRSVISAEKETVRKKTKVLKTSWLIIGLIVSSLIVVFAYLLFQKRLLPPSKTVIPGIENKPVVTNDKVAPISPKSANHRNRQIDKQPILAALALETYKKELEKTLAPATYMSNKNTSVSMDSVEVAYARKDFERVLQLANAVPADYSNVNAVNWFAAHAAFHLNDCATAEKYATLVQENNTIETRSQQADLLLLLIWTICAQTESPKFQQLLQSCANDRFHPGHEFALDYSQRIKPAQ